ncbi:MAG: hypothetical protein GC155_10550 [Alphaproteobacteria bacterium]|nr:hypothetical protein [Alphaproteobacteria bacterium]
MSEWRISGLQIAIIDAIVTIFESGQPANYGAIAHDPKDAGGLSYGKHQASLTSGNLYNLVSAYCATPEAQCSAEFRPYLDRMKARDRTLDSDRSLILLLQRAAKDPVMQKVQDEFFTANFMEPALKKWQALGFTTALSAGVVYDSFINSGSLNLEKMTTEKYGAPSAENERDWTAKYVATRKAWLAQYYPANVVRMETFEGLVQKGDWDLSLPIRVSRGQNYFYPLTAYDLAAHFFDSAIRRLGAAAFGLAKASETTAVPNGRARFIQSSLQALQYPVGAVDGRYGKGTAIAVKQFQKACGLPQTGDVDAQCFDQLCAALEEKGTTTNGDTEAVRDHGLVDLPEEKRTSTTAAKTGAGVAAGAAGVAGIAGAAASGGGDDQQQAAQEAAAPAAVTTQAADAAPPQTAQAVAPPGDQTAVQAPVPGEAASAPATAAMDGAAAPTAGAPSTPAVHSSAPAAQPPPPVPATSTSTGSTATTSSIGIGDDQIHIFGVTVPESVLALSTAGLFVLAIILFAHGRRKSY